MIIFQWSWPLQLNRFSNSELRSHDFIADQKNIYIKGNTLRAKPFESDLDDERLTIIIIIFWMMQFIFQIKYITFFVFHQMEMEITNNNTNEFYILFRDLKFRLWKPKSVFLINCKCFSMGIMHLLHILVRFSSLLLNYFGQGSEQHFIFGKNRWIFVPFQVCIE